MAHGREEAYDTEERQAAPARPMPVIRGVRPPEDLEDDVDAMAREPDAPAIDPWGVAEPEPDYDPTPTDPTPQPRRRGGGTLTIPLLCIGVAIIACVALLPLADENHQLAWEREKLKIDLTYIQEQTRVQDEFLTRVADDPTLAERLAQRQMRYIREGSTVLPLRGSAKEEMSPFHLVSVPPPPPLPPYQPVGGILATIVRQPRAQLYLYGAALLLIATGLVLGYTPKATPGEQE